MNIQVYPHRIILNKTNEVNSGEYNVNECTFEFSQEYEGLTKVAVFSLCDGTTKNVTILNNQCIIPVECLQETGQVQIGVYGYATQDNELVLRYSPTPQNFVVRLGSYKEGTQPVAPTPTDWEILVEQVSDIAEDVSSIHEDITGINGEISGINIDIRDLQDTKANISDLAEVAFTGEFSDLKNIPSYATTQQLNQEIQDRQDADVNLQSQIDNNKTDIDTINTNLVNYSLITETGSKITLTIDNTTYQMYATLKDKNNNTINTSNVIDLPIEQLVMSVDYDNTAKEIVIELQNGEITRVPVGALISGLVSETQLEETLEDYVKNTDYASSSKGGVIKVSDYYNYVVSANSGVLYTRTKTYQEYTNLDANAFIGKGTLENVITGKDLTTKAYVDGLVGNIGTILDNINGEVIGG